MRSVSNRSPREGEDIPTARIQDAAAAHDLDGLRRHVQRGDGEASRLKGQAVAPRAGTNVQDPSPAKSQGRLV